MERQEIQQAVTEIKSTEDFVLLLNRVKQDTLGEKSHPFRLNQITYYCNPKRENVERYRHFTIPKKGGGERQISAPVAGLKSILFSLNTVLQAVYEPSKYAMGFAAGRSVVDNAKIHTGQRYVYNIDLKDFFPSIDKSRVWKRLMLPPMNLSSDLAHLVAGLCTMRLEEGENVRYALPQGAPTSPIITNMICDNLDRQLAKLAKRLGLRYSRYADDITFSSMHYVYNENGAFVKALHQIIEQQRFTINPRKTRLQQPNQRREVTGIVVSDKVNVTRQYTRELKTLLHIWQKYGYVAARESYRRARINTMHFFDKKDGFDLSAVVMGKLLYMKMVKGGNDPIYQRLMEQYRTLKKADSKITYQAKETPITYLETFTKEEFEQMLSTKIEEGFNRNERRYVYFMQSGEECRLCISSKIPNADLEQLMSNDGTELWKKYNISLCDNGHSHFYMLHKKLVPVQYTASHISLMEELQAEFAELDLDSIIADLDELKAHQERYEVVRTL